MITKEELMDTSTGWVIEYKKFYNGDIKYYLSFYDGMELNYKNELNKEEVKSLLDLKD